MSQNGSSSGHVKAAFIGGIFAVIAACVTGGFLLVNTLLEKGVTITPQSPTSTPAEAVATSISTDTPILPIMPPSPTIMPQPSPTLSPESQQVRWWLLDGQEAGICTNGCAEFIPWVELRKEIQQKLLPQVSNIPTGSTLALRDFQGKRDWIVQIISPGGSEIGHIWFGPDPFNDWEFDGLVRVGSPSTPVAVWGTFQRYSDGSYQRQ